MLNAFSLQNIFWLSMLPNAYYFGASFQNQAFPKLLFIIKILLSMVAVKEGERGNCLLLLEGSRAFWKKKCFCFVTMELEVRKHPEASLHTSEHIWHLLYCCFTFPSPMTSEHGPYFHILLFSFHTITHVCRQCSSLIYINCLRRPK